MRILFFESNWANMHGLPDGLRDLGHDVLVSGPLSEGRIVTLIKHYHPHLLLTMGWGPEQKVTTQKLIRKYAKAYNIPLAYWATEDWHFSQSFTIPLLKRMRPDFVFTLTRDLVQYYRSIGFKSAHMDFGYHSSVHYPTDSVDQFRCDIAIVANAYPDVLQNSPKHYRHQCFNILLAPLLKENIRVDIWGKEWDRMKGLGYDIPSDWLHGFLSYKDTNKVFNSAKIIIGFQNYTNQVTRRTREILASGGLLLTTDTPEVRRLFSPGENIVVSSSPQETLRLIKYYLHEHPEQRKRIRQQAPLAVARDTYKHRAEYMLDVLGKNGVLIKKQPNLPKLLLHTIKKGETLWQISKKYNVTVKTIKKLNKLSDDTIFPGQGLIVFF